MDKLPLTLDLDALRSFVTGIECGSFALAASRLCRSTSVRCRTGDEAGPPPGINPQWRDPDGLRPSSAGAQ